MPISGREWLLVLLLAIRSRPAATGARSFRASSALRSLFSCVLSDGHHGLREPTRSKRNRLPPHKERQRATKHNSHYFTFKTHFIGAQRCVEASTRPDG